MHARALELLISRLQPGARVLDVGSVCLVLSCITTRHLLQAAKRSANDRRYLSSFITHMHHNRNINVSNSTFLVDWSGTVLSIGRNLLQK
jgi:hypothetical protein